MDDNTVDTAVLVVGAGIGGLAAADQLAGRGVEVTVVEARSRTGGRLLSTSVAGSKLDIGATWWWEGEHRVQALLERFGLSTFDQHLSGDTLLEDPDGVQRLRGNLLDVPAGRYTGGADSLTRALAATLPTGSVHLDEPVVHLELSPTGDRVTANTGRRTWRAQHVVLAVPPALAVSRMTFSPGLGDETVALAAATPVWMGHILKIVAVFPAPFWRGLGLAGAAVSRVGPLHEIHDMSGPHGQPAALLGFAAASVGIAGLRDAIREQLVRLFGPEAATVTAIHVRDWSTEEWTTPTGSAPSTRHDLFGHPRYHRPAMGGRLHWATTETTPDVGGHVEGALAAAERAVAAIRTDLDPTPSTTRSRTTPTHTPES